jgi:hypothetical protein
MNISAPTRFGWAGSETTPSGRMVSVAGAGYVTAWLLGLLTGPATPSSSAPDATSTATTSSTARRSCPSPR